jgi:hypothetical protein
VQAALLLGPPAVGRSRFGVNQPSGGCGAAHVQVGGGPKGILLNPSPVPWLTGSNRLEADRMMSGLLPKDAGVIGARVIGVRESCGVRSRSVRSGSLEVKKWCEA